jgi:hypothetical protein
VDQVVEWPALELLEGQLENVSPFLKNTTTDVCVLHLYGPVFEQTDPDLPLDVTGVCVCVSLIVISP